MEDFILASSADSVDSAETDTTETDTTETDTTETDTTETDTTETDTTETDTTETDTTETDTTATDTTETDTTATDTTETDTTATGTTTTGTTTTGTTTTDTTTTDTTTTGTTTTGTTTTGTTTTGTTTTNTTATDTTATDTATANQITIGENVTGSTNVGKVDGSDDYIYIGGVGVISDYAGATYDESGESGAKIRYATDFLGFSFDGINLVMNSSTGALIVQNCKDKLISIADPTGNTTAYVYSPTANGAIYGNFFSPLEVIWGSDVGADILIAGNAGSTLWGGSGAFDDTLVGGAGHDEYIYFDGCGNDVIANYGTEDLIKINGTFNGVNLFGNFALNFSNGSLTLADAWDRIITVADMAGNICGQACYASAAGILDGRGLVGKEVLVGAAFGSNLIIAGDGGSSLWANFGGVDTLVGGAGVDEFIYTPGSGVAFVQNATPFDMINLYGVTADQIAGVAITATDTTITFKDGGALNVQGVGSAYKLGNALYVADNKTGTFKQI